MADLGSVELTRDNQAMISALRKISDNSYVSKANDSISSFFIADPRILGIDKVKEKMRSHAVIKRETKTSIWDTHPSIDDRIDRLMNY
jgi:Zn-dependent protease with chaperone function